MSGIYNDWAWKPPRGVMSALNRGNLKTNWRRHAKLATWLDPFEAVVMYQRRRHRKVKKKRSKKNARRR